MNTDTIINAENDTDAEQAYKDAMAAVTAPIWTPEWVKETNPLAAALRTYHAGGSSSVDPEEVRAAKAAKAAKSAERAAFKAEHSKEAGRVCRDCGVRFFPTPGRGRPPVKCTPCRAK